MNSIQKVERELVVPAVAIPTVHVDDSAYPGERINIKGVYRLEKYLADPVTGLPLWDELLEEPMEATNAFVNSGCQVLLDLLIGVAATNFGNTNAAIGVGDSATAPAVGQTDLQATTNKLRKGMDATFPSRAGQVNTWRSTFGSAEANYAWNESGLFNATAGGAMLSRLTTGWGTKVAGTSWVMSYTVTMP